MRSSPSPPVRLVAVLALILVVSGVAFLLLHGSGGSNSANNPPPAGTISRTHTTTTTEKPEKKGHKNQVEGVAALDAALLSHPVVVVSVFAQNVSTDTDAMNEAKAGAAAVDAGFVPFNVYNEKIARELGKLLGNLDLSTPTVLIFKRPRKLVFQHDGFVDSKVVAQAADDVYPVQEPWVREASGICTHYASQIENATTSGFSISTGTTTTVTSSQAMKLDQVPKLLNAEAQALTRVRAQASKASSYAKLIADYQAASPLVADEVKALEKSDQTGLQAAVKQIAPLITAIDGLASELGLSSCSA